MTKRKTRWVVRTRYDNGVWHSISATTSERVARLTFERMKKQGMLVMLERWDLGKVER